jgi:hypothetical protein
MVGAAESAPFAEAGPAAVGERAELARTPASETVRSVSRTTGVRRIGCAEDHALRLRNSLVRV